PIGGDVVARGRAAAPVPTDAPRAPIGGDAAALGRAARSILEQAARTAATHERFLSFSAGAMALQQTALAQRLALVARLGGGADADPPPPVRVVAERRGEPGVAFDRDACMEFAVGPIRCMLGPAWAALDEHPTRVRLPDEPLMLVDRIVRVEGEPLSLRDGRVVTEHDVHPGAWYLDGGRAPVCISVEAGQADLFLSAWLGIDHQTK